jgi:endonuclease/exonuclease/phosphatase family metal-dependent hydrolase
LATFNILHGRSPADDRVDVDRLASAVRALDADVLGLQEVDRDQPRSLMADLTTVAAEAMGAPEHRFVAALTGTPGLTWQAASGDEQPGTAAYGIALLSRYPVRGWQVLRLPPMRVPVPLRHGRGRPHLARDEARVAVMATVQGPFGDVLVATTHLSFLPAWNALQLRRVVRAMATQSGPAILMGDLNMEPALVRRLTRMRPLANAPTFPAAEPTRQLDHILARGLSANGSGVAVSLPLSDHLALSVDISATPG